MQQISAGDLHSSDLFFHQVFWRQQRRHQIHQLPLKVFIDVWDTAVKTINPTLNSGFNSVSISTSHLTMEAAIKVRVGGHLEARVWQQKAADFGET